MRTAANRGLPGQQPLVQRLDAPRRGRRRARRAGGRAARRRPGAPRPRCRWRPAPPSTGDGRSRGRRIVRPDPWPRAERSPAPRRRGPTRCGRCTRAPPARAPRARGAPPGPRRPPGPAGSPGRSSSSAASGLLERSAPCHVPGGFAGRLDGAGGHLHVDPDRRRQGQPQLLTAVERRRRQGAAQPGQDHAQVGLGVLRCPAGPDDVDERAALGAAVVPGQQVGEQRPGLARGHGGD